MKRKPCGCGGLCFHGWQYDMANAVLLETLTGGAKNAKANGYHRHPIRLRNAIADALVHARAMGRRAK